MATPSAQYSLRLRIEREGDYIIPSVFNPADCPTMARADAEEARHVGLTRADAQLAPSA